MSNTDETLNTANIMNATTLNQDGPLSLRPLQPSIATNRLATERETLVDEALDSRNGHSSPTPAAKKRNWLRPVLAGVAVVGLSVAASNYYTKEIAPFESTDDAFIEAHVTPIAPQVAGRVAQLLVADNQRVKQGDVLVQIDPSDYQAKLDQVRAALASAKSRLEQANVQISVDAAKVEQEKANVVAAQA